MRYFPGGRHAVCYNRQGQNQDEKGAPCMQMQKTEFIAQVAERAGVPKKQARQVIDSALDLIAQQLSEGNRVVLTGFGTFEVRNRQARQGVNPQTKQSMTIAATQTPGFSASNSLKHLVRTGRGRLPSEQSEPNEQSGQSA
jgi:DNA-binding protein HU-beta